MSEMNLNQELKKDKIGIGIGAFGYNLGAAGLITYLTFFYTDHMLIPAASVAMILFASRLIDAFTDLFVGYMIDRTKSKHGKVRPWLLWMAVPAVISIAATYYVPNFSESGRVIYAFITYNLMAFFYLTALALPMQAIGSVITQDGTQRLKISQIWGVFNTFAAVCINLFASRVMGLFGGGTSGFFYYFSFVGLLGGILMLICFKLTKERTVKSKKYDKVPLGVGLKALFSNRYWFAVTIMQVIVALVPSMWAVTAYYVIYWLNGGIDVGALMSMMWGGITLGIFAFIPVSRRIGKPKSAALGFTLQILGSVLLIIAPTSIPMAWVSTFFRAFGVGGYSGTMIALRSDVVDYGDWKTGVRTEGLIFSGGSFGMKVGQGIGGAIVAGLLAWGGYVAGAATQSARALGAIKFAFVYCPLIFTSLIVVCLFFLFSLEDKMPQIRKELAERNANEAAN